MFTVGVRGHSEGGHESTNFTVTTGRYMLFEMKDQNRAMFIAGVGGHSEGGHIFANFPLQANTLFEMQDNRTMFTVGVGRHSEGGQREICIVKIQHKNTQQSNNTQSGVLT